MRRLYCAKPAHVEREAGKPRAGEGAVRSSAACGEASWVRRHRRRLRRGGDALCLSYMYASNGRPPCEGKSRREHANKMKKPPNPSLLTRRFVAAGCGGEVFDREPFPEELSAPPGPWPCWQAYSMSG